MCVCVCVCMCVCVYVYVCECVNIYMHIYTIDQLSIPDFNLNNGIFVYSNHRSLISYLICMTDRCLGRAEGEQKLPRSAGTPSEEEIPPPLNLNLNPPSSSFPSLPFLPCFLSCFLAFFTYPHSFILLLTSLRS